MRLCSHALQSMGSNATLPNNRGDLENKNGNKANRSKHNLGLHFSQTTCGPAGGALAREDCEVWRSV